MAAPRYGSQVSSGAPRRWRVVVLALLAAILACLPRGAQAGLWSDDRVAAYGLEAELGQLRATRERIARREALRWDLRRTAGEARS